MRSDIYARLLQAAIDGATVNYQQLGGGRFMIGRYLYRIALEEKAVWRPPLTAVVVTRRDGRPAPGFHRAMQDIGYVRDGESAEATWRRAIQEVHDYWRPRLHDDLS